MGTRRLDAATLSVWEVQAGTHRQRWALEVAREHLRLAWFVVPEPWVYEDQIIEVMKPPMNRDHNHSHPLYKRMGEARERFREAARTSSA